MRLSVIAVSLVLLFSQSALAQHSSGGGGSSGGGSSSGGSSSGSSGGGSHGGGSGGGGSSGGSSGGHASGASSGSHASGSSGSAHSGNSHASSGFVHAPGKIDPAHETANGPAGEPAFYSNVHADPSEVHNQLLDQALAKLQFAVPTNLKNDQPVSVKSLKRIEPALERKTEVKAETKKEEPDRKPCHGHHCKPRPEYCTTGTNWRVSQQLYTTIQDDCGRLATRLSKEENKVSALNAAQDSACAMNPLGSSCTSATEVLNKLNAKIAQLHDRYDQCVFHDLRHNAALYISQK